MKLQTALSRVWRAVPRRVRRAVVTFVEPTFTVTIGAVVVREDGRVLMLEHAFRPGAGWGLPGGFIRKDEQPADAVRRELREEVGLEVDDVEWVSARTLVGINQVELVYRCRPVNEPVPRSLEIVALAWHAPDALPATIPPDQRRVVARAVGKERSS